MLCILILSWRKGTTLCHHYFMTAPFVQDSTTYVMELNTKLEGKRKLHWQSCLVWNSMKGKAVSWTKYQQNSKPSILNLSVWSSTSPENWQTLEDKLVGIWKHLQNVLCSRFRNFSKETYEIQMFEPSFYYLRWSGSSGDENRNKWIMTLWKVLSPNEMYGIFMGPVWKP